MIRWYKDKPTSDPSTHQPEAKGLLMQTQASADGKPTPGENHSYEYDGRKWNEISNREYVAKKAAEDRG